MNAKEARVIAHAAINTESSRQYLEIINLIKKASNIGNLYTYYYEPIKIEVKSKLEYDGYKLKAEYNQKDGTTITICW